MLKEETVEEETVEMIIGGNVVWNMRLDIGVKIMDTKEITIGGNVVWNL